MTEVREITRTLGKLARSAMIASVSPSARCRCEESADRSANGKTATDGLVLGNHEAIH